MVVTAKERGQPLVYKEALELAAREDGSQGWQAHKLAWKIRDK